MFQNTASLIIVFFSIALQASEQSANGYVSAPTVNLGYVSYAGYQNTTAGINYYRAIPYAQPPLGELRWKKPRPIELSNDFTGQTVDATQIGPACYRSLPGSLLTPFFTGSSSIIWPWMGQSENCLILDVLTPAQPVSSSLPVLVQIHGGGYTAGDTQTYPGDALVNASNGNIIYVSIQYRLGIFGFLGGSAIAEDGVLNAGLLDQRSALEWIQRNIRQFGGDPSRVTIWGGSAGGGSVSYQLIAGGAYDEPPFSAAIAEYPWWQPLLNASTQERQYFTALTLSNCSDLDCLRSLSSESLQTLNQAVQNASYPGPGNGFGDFWFGPVVDGKFIRRLPDVEYKTGNFYKVPLIVDRDAYEGYIFSNATDNSGTQEYETSDAQNLFPFAGPSFFSRLYSLYPISGFNSTLFQRQTWFGDFIINCPTYYMATAMNDYSYNESAVFKLTFAAGSQLHGATASFLISNVTGWSSAPNQTLAEILSSYWISFAVTQDPNPLSSSSAPWWPSYVSGGNGTASNGESVGFDVLAITAASIGFDTDPDASAQCDFFGSRGYQLAN